MQRVKVVLSVMVGLAVIVAACGLLMYIEDNLSGGVAFWVLFSWIAILSVCGWERHRAIDDVLARVRREPGDEARGQGRTRIDVDAWPREED